MRWLLDDLHQQKFDDNGSVELEIKDLGGLYSTDGTASCAYGIKANSLENPVAEFRSIGKHIFTLTTRRGLEPICSSCFRRQRNCSTTKRSQNETKCLLVRRFVTSLVYESAGRKSTQQLNRRFDWDQKVVRWNIRRDFGLHKQQYSSQQVTKRLPWTIQNCNSGLKTYL